MEDSAKRREKLQAWRMEAAVASAAPQPPYSSPPPRAAAPLPSFTDASIRLPPPADSMPAPRFGFYTDPLAAFSGNKRQRGGGAAAGYSPSSSPRAPSSSLPYAEHRNYPVASNHPSVPTYNMTQIPNYGPYEMPTQTPHSNTWRSPVRLPAPVASNYPSVSPYNMTQIPNYGPYEMPSQSPHSNTWRSPVRLPTPFSGFTSTSPSGHEYVKSVRGGFTPQFGRGDSPVGYAGFRGSSHSHPGRGSGRPFKDSPTSHWSGGRGRGSYGNSSNQRGTKGYYMKAMVKDPWRKLKPIVGNILEPLGGPTSWLPKQLTTEKAKASGSSIQFNSKSSLAEYLAASFDEAAEN